MVKTDSKHYETLTDWAREKAQGVTYPIAKFLQKLGLHPNTVTLLGTALNVGVACVIGAGYPRLGGLLLWAASATDALDGALARVTGQKSRFGAFLDSTMDRISEGALFIGLLVWLTPQAPAWELGLLMATLLGSLLVSYTRARAEGVGYACKVGLFTRVERILLLGLGLMLGWGRPTLMVMAALVWFTVGQRMWYVYRESRRNP